MCRTGVAPEAHHQLAAVLTSLRNRLAADWHVHPDLIRVGPVDLGPDTNPGNPP